MPHCNHAAVDGEAESEEGVEEEEEELDEGEEEEFDGYDAYVSVRIRGYSAWPCCGAQLTLLARPIPCRCNTRTTRGTTMMATRGATMRHTTETNLPLFTPLSASYTSTGSTERHSTQATDNILLLEPGRHT
jgi:hypothetical protein